MAFVAIFLAAQDPPASQRVSCDVESVLSRSPAGIAQVSNLGGIYVRAGISYRRPVPKGGVLDPIHAQAIVYEVAADNTRKIVESIASSRGGGGDTNSEYVSLSLSIPIDSSEREAASREYLAYLVSHAESSTDNEERAMAPILQKIGPSAFTGIFGQHRVGHFQEECRVVDQGRLLGVGRADLEVLFKGRFFDQDAFRKK
jgi:hypothetical protein